VKGLNRSKISKGREFRPGLTLRKRDKGTKKKLWDFE